MVDTTSSSPAAKRVRFDDSVNHGLEQPARPIDSSESETGNPVSALPSCRANDAIRLHGGENHITLACAAAGCPPTFDLGLLYRLKRRCARLYVVFNVIPSAEAVEVDLFHFIEV